jgi:hypothetical protein
VLRSYLNQIAVDPSVSATAKAELNIQPRHEPVPTPPPASQPVVTFMGIVNDFDIVVKSVDLLSGKKAKPRGVAATSYYSYVGENPPPTSSCGGTRASRARASSSSA